MPLNAVNDFRRSGFEVHVRLWKSHDWDALNRLHEQGYIENPVSKNKSVGLTEAGRAKSEELFRKLFGKAK